MSAIGSKGVSSSPDVSDNTIITNQRQLSGEGGGEKVEVHDSKQTTGSASYCWGASESSNTLRVFKTPVLTPRKLLKGLGDKMAAAFRFVFMRKKKKKRPSTKAAASGKSRKFIAPDDSHRSEAIADCIEFINSSSLNRSSSISANSQ